MDNRHLIEPENLALWTTVTFIIALLSLVIGFTNLYRTAAATALTQMQMLELSQKIEALSHKGKP
jgi:Sec-independent protein secretion pathway component TatC